MNTRLNKFIVAWTALILTACNCINIKHAWRHKCSSFHEINANVWRNFVAGESLTCLPVGTVYEFWKLHSRIGWVTDTLYTNLMSNCALCRVHYPFKWVFFLGGGLMIEFGDPPTKSIYRKTHTLKQVLHPKYSAILYWTNKKYFAVSGKSTVQFWKIREQSL